MSLATHTAPDPSNPDQLTERACVGALILGSATMQDATLATVADDDFSDPKCRWVVRLIRGMRAAGEPVDQVTISGWVRDRGLLPNTGNAADFTGSAVRRHGLELLLHQLAMDAPEVSSRYAPMVVRAAARRAAAEVGQDLIAVADGGELVDVKAVALARLSRLMVVLDRAMSV